MPRRRSASSPSRATSALRYRRRSAGPWQISARTGRGDLYIARFQADDAHLPFEADVATALRKAFYSYDGATPDANQSTGFLPPGEAFLSTIRDDVPLPPWLDEAHFSQYVATFEASGFRGPVDWYRCLDLNWALTAFVQDKRIHQPSLFLVGERDPVRHYAGAHEAGQSAWLTDLRGQHVIPGAGHWLPQERADEVNARLLAFLAEIDGTG